MFASDLGLPPGHWPMTLTFDGRTWTRFSKMFYADEFVGYVYSDGGERMDVYND